MSNKTILFSGASYALDVKPDRLDLRDRPYLPPAVSLAQQWPRDSDVGVLIPAYVTDGLILDQGQEGACTGYGLAAVINYLLWMRDRQSGHGSPFKSVSPHMLYDMARFYDEWPGQDYEGSSCRGAMKGWHKHGVCEQQYWGRSIYPVAASTGHVTAGKQTKTAKTKAPPPSTPYTPDAARWPADAASRPMGVYYRVDKDAVTDMQAAIYDVGAIYVSCQVHAGWSEMGTSGAVDVAQIAHANLPRIRFDANAKPTGGHAFALVGYNAHGFVVQNSWGRQWGNNGFAVLTYDDWMQNGTDAWVCALGVPQSGTVGQGRVGNATRSLYSGSLLSRDKPIRVKTTDPLAKPWDTATAMPHCIVAGNDGEVVIARPDHASPAISIAHTVGLFKDWATEWLNKNPGKTPKLVIYAHGGLNGEETGIERARVLAPYFKENGVYPIFYIWQTGFLEVLGQAIMDRLPIDPFQAKATGLLGDARDSTIEALAHGPFRFMWRQMKQNADAAQLSTHALGLLHQQLTALATEVPFETHCVAHSAGSFVVGHLMSLGHKVTSLSLFAPACSLAFALEHIAPHAPQGKTALHLLTAEAERNDTTGLKPPFAYGKSLLWLVCRGFEELERTPLAGLAHCLDPHATQLDDENLWRRDQYPQVQLWRNWVSGLARLSEVRPAVNQTNEHLTTLPNQRCPGTHGGFDNDINVMTQTIELITGTPLVLPIEDLKY